MSETDTSEIVWRPTKEYMDRARIARFMRAHGVATLAELHRRSVDDPAWYWDAVSKDLGLRWLRPYTRVLDPSRGIGRASCRERVFRVV